MLEAWSGNASLPRRTCCESFRIVLHEIAHHFGISDERQKEIDRY
jgi:predicted Zn-dependent protease with MMP-like domain